MELTRLTLEQGEKITSVEVPKTDLEYLAFMDLVRAIISTTDYKSEEIDDYILYWAASIRASHEN